MKLPTRRFVIEFGPLAMLSITLSHIQQKKSKKFDPWTPWKRRSECSDP
jgi:hypothetical protein